VVSKSLGSILGMLLVLFILLLLTKFPAKDLLQALGLYKESGEGMTPAKDGQSLLKWFGGALVVIIVWFVFPPLSWLTVISVLFYLLFDGVIQKVQSSLATIK
jgi:hypothetical protein